MTNLNNKIFISSINKAVNLSKVFGKLNLEIISLLYILDYYINFTNDKDIYNSLNRNLKLFVSRLKNKYPNELCNYKLKVSNNYTIIPDGNTAPLVDDRTIDIDGEYAYEFQSQDFLLNYQDAENNDPDKIIIYPSENPTNQDVITYQGNVITAPIEISINDVNQVRWQDSEQLIQGYEIGDAETDDNLPINNKEVNYSFKFRVSDNHNETPLFSTLTTMTMTNSQYLNNLPGSIGDITKTVGNRVTTFLTLSTFTDNMNPPYSDPENDDIDAIRIDKVYSSNEGEFLYNNVEVSEGQIITAAELDNNLFKHVGPNQDSVNTDMIDFSARDTGSLIWVQ